MEPLREKLDKLGVLQNFLAMGEKGGVWITYDESGTPKEHVDKNISVPLPLANEVRELINTEFSDYMFYDESKKTMISTEMIDGKNLDEYRKRQQVLSKILEEIVKRYGLIDSLEIDPTIIATDIQDKHVGKDFAARKILEWLRQKGVKPEQVIAFGDSRSDLAMAQEVLNQGIPIRFVFVDNEDSLSGTNVPFPVIFTKEHFDKGTLEYLTSHR